MQQKNNSQNIFKGNHVHLDVLSEALEKKDIRIWNDWRLDDPSVLPNLKGIDLVGMNLIGINFSGADLSDANLSKVNLSTAELSGVVLAGANLQEAKLVHATLFGGGLGKANLYNADLDGATLNNATLTNSTLTGAIIRGISREGWKIDNIKCEYVYLDQNRKIREPETGIYDEGEFESLYKHSPLIKHIFIDDFTYIDILIMDKVVKEINDQNPEYKLKLDSFHARGKARAEFVIKDIRDSKKILAEIQKRHESTKREFEHQLELMNFKIDTYKECVSNAIQHPSILIENFEVNNYNQIWVDFQKNSENNIEKLVVELSNIRKALKIESVTAEHDHTIGEIATAEQLLKLGEGSTAIKHLKNVGKWVLNVSTNLGTNIATELIKKSMGL